MRRGLIVRRHPVLAASLIAFIISLALIPAFICGGWTTADALGGLTAMLWTIQIVWIVAGGACWGLVFSDWEPAWEHTKSALAARRTVRKLGADARVIEAQPSGSVVRLYVTRTAPLRTGEVRLERIHVKTFDAEAESDACQAFVSAWRDAEHARRADLGTVSDEETSARALAQSINDC